MSLLFATFLLLLYGNLPPLLLRLWLKKRFPKFAKFLIFYALLFSTLQIGIALDEIGGFKKERDFQKVKSLIFQKDADVERQMVAFLLAAEGMKNDFLQGQHNDEIPNLLTKIGEAAITTLSQMGYLQDSTQWKDNMLFLSQLSIILSDIQQVKKDKKPQNLNEKIVLFLQKEMLQSPNTNLKSYSAFSGKWLCDNAGVIYALYLYDQQQISDNKPSDLHSPVLKKWKDFVYVHAIDGKSNLPCAQISDSLDCYEAARASSSAWLIAYLSLLKTEEAVLFGKTYNKNFKFSLLGMGAAYKEFPNGWSPSHSIVGILDNNSDYDSGPIVFGLGTYASGLSIYTSACRQDALTYMQLKNAFWVVSWFQKWLTNEDVLISTLLYNAETRW